MLLSSPSWLLQYFLTGFPTSILFSFQCIRFTPGREIQDCLHYCPAETSQGLYRAFSVNSRTSVFWRASHDLATTHVHCAPGISSWSLSSSHISFHLVSQTFHGPLSPHLPTLDINLIYPFHPKSAFTSPGMPAQKDQPRSRLSITHPQSTWYFCSYH